MSSLKRSVSDDFKVDETVVHKLDKVNRVGEKV